MKISLSPLQFYFLSCPSMAIYQSKLPRTLPRWSYFQSSHLVLVISSFSFYLFKPNKSCFRSVQRFFVVHYGIKSLNLVQLNTLFFITLHMHQCGRHFKTLKQLNFTTLGAASGLISRRNLIYCGERLFVNLRNFIFWKCIFTAYP